MPGNKTLASSLSPSVVPQVKHDYAVQFGGAVRQNGPKTYPYVYNFIRYPYQQGIIVDNTGQYSITGDSAEGPDGLDLAPGGILNVPIKLDNDLPYHLLYAHVGAFRVSQFTTLCGTGGGFDTLAQPANGDAVTTTQQIVFDVLPAAFTLVTAGQAYFIVNANAATFQISLTSGGAPIALGVASAPATWRRVSNCDGSREYLLYPYSANLQADQVGLLNASRNTRIPYWTELDMSAYMASSGARDLYGGFQRDPISGATQEIPIPILDVQGAQDGMGMLRTPFQLAAGAIVNLRFVSRSIYPLRVYGNLYGYKITV